MLLLLLHPTLVPAQINRGDCPFYEEFRTLSLEDRETLACREILSGNVPEYMKGFIRITTRQKDLNGKEHRLQELLRDSVLWPLISD